MMDLISFNDCTQDETLKAFSVSLFRVIQESPEFLLDIANRIKNEIGYNQYVLAQDELRNSNIVVVYGLSLGDTDKIWRDTIGELLDYNNTQIVIFGHKQLDEINSVMPEDTIDYVEDKQEAFLKKIFPNISDEKLDNLRDSISIIDKTNCLNFEIVHSPSLVAV